MSVFEQLFNDSVLDITVPDTSLDFPSSVVVADDWLRRLKSPEIQREQAFFDEDLYSLLTIRIENLTPGEPVDPESPPAELLRFLAHLQIALEASYVSPVDVASDIPLRLSAPPRKDSVGKVKQLGGLSHPSIFPPHTPNPTPSTVESDKKYVRSEGTLLQTSIWGQSASGDSREAFALLWSEDAQTWVAVYRLAVGVSFLRLPVSDPLLCLTISATLRDKPLAKTHPKHPLLVYISFTGTSLDTLFPPPQDSTGSRDDAHNDLDVITGFEEVNLLEGLLAGPTFQSSGRDKFSLPSTRLSAKLRHDLFSIQPAALASPLQTPSTSSTTPSRGTHATLRKSFRRTLQTVSGFRVRMRTVFVPYVLLQSSHDRGDPADIDEEERERREAGSAEHTVVLCVEVENSGEGGAGVGFAVESVDVHVSGEGARASLIGWGEAGPAESAEKRVFPLLVGSMEQYNLLYAVSFLRSPNDADSLSLAPADPARASRSADSELQRAVTININGKPYTQMRLDQTSAESISAGSISYPTNTFPSRWNCILDLSSPQHQPKPSHTHSEYPPSAHRDALPEPASPFPMTAPQPTATIKALPELTPFMAGSKRHTIASARFFPRLTASPTGSPGPNFRASTPLLASQHARDSLPPPSPLPLPSAPASSGKFTLPSVSVSAQGAQGSRLQTTYAAPQLFPPMHLTSPPLPLSPVHHNDAPPPTPAYPSYPPASALPPAPHSQLPVAAHHTGAVGPSVDIRRDAAPGSAGPTVAGAFSGGSGGLEDVREPIVVSIGLLGGGVKQVRPLDEFTLDVFVFNKSSWTRRFEIGLPGRRRGAGRGGGGGVGGVRMVPGVLPLDNRVRIGPLRPGTCQSVRMTFLAMRPGVHAIDALVLTDVETGYATNLRSVLDVVVHETGDE